MSNQLTNQLTRFEQVALDHIRRNTTPEQRAAIIAAQAERYLQSDEWQPRPMPARGNLSNGFDWILHEGLALALGAIFAVTVVVVIVNLLLKIVS